MSNGDHIEEDIRGTARPATDDPGTGDPGTTDPGTSDPLGQALRKAAKVAQGVQGSAADIMNADPRDTHGVLDWPGFRPGTALQHWIGAFNTVVSLNDVGAHQYFDATPRVPKKVVIEGADRTLLGDYGLIYTCLGGFIDVAHARDAADHALFAAVKACALFPTGESFSYSDNKYLLEKKTEPYRINVKFAKWADVSTTATPESSVCRWVGAAIAYHYQTWYEIESWSLSHGIVGKYQRVSCFSPEDNYSHMLGVKIGYHASEDIRGYNLSADRLFRREVKRLRPLARQHAEVVRQSVAQDPPESGWYPTTPPGKAPFGTDSRTYKTVNQQGNSVRGLFRRHLDAYPDAKRSSQIPTRVEPWLVRMPADPPEGFVGCARVKKGLDAKFPRFPEEDAKLRPGKKKEDLFEFTVSLTTGLQGMDSYELASAIGVQGSPVAKIKAKDFYKCIRELRTAVRKLYSKGDTNPLKP